MLEPRAALLDSKLYMIHTIEHTQMHVRVHAEFRRERRGGCASLRRGDGESQAAGRRHPRGRHSGAHYTYFPDV